ncbi:hypothetical protein GCM10022222_16650 [Amycolatopsis ultiminotia]|uniref:Secreted protein n=1 Tax=Amycolatopsis ultiminotia TaxID=543629 RepID=A0ABP6VFK1_9PSEU
MLLVVGMGLVANGLDTRSWSSRAEALPAVYSITDRPEPALSVGHHRRRVGFAGTADPSTACTARKITVWIVKKDHRANRLRRSPTTLRGTAAFLGQPSPPHGP